MFPTKCAHDTTRQASLRISMRQWTHVVRLEASFVALNAEFLPGHRVRLDAAAEVSGATTLRVSRSKLGANMVEHVLSPPMQTPADLMAFPQIPQPADASVVQQLYVAHSW